MLYNKGGGDVNAVRRRLTRTESKSQFCVASISMCVKVSLIRWPSATLRSHCFSRLGPYGRGKPGDWTVPCVVVLVVTGRGTATATHSHTNTQRSSSLWYTARSRTHANAHAQRSQMFLPGCGAQVECLFNGH